MIRIALLGVLTLAPLLTAQSPTRSGLKDADGKVIPDFVSKLPFPGAKPEGYLGLNDFNARAQQLVGTKVIVDGNLRGEAWWSDGPAVAITDNLGGLPSNFDFVVDSDMQTAARKLTANTFGTTLPVRLNGTVRNSARASWKIFVIDEMSLLGPNGDAVWTTKRTKAHDSSIQRGSASTMPPSARFNPGSSTRPARGTVQQPAIVTDNGSNTPADPAAVAGTALWVVFAVIAAVLLAIVFTIFAVVYFAMKAKKRDRQDNDDDDIDEDEDYRPRRRRRRPEDRD